MENTSLVKIYNDFFSYQEVLKQAEQEYAAHTYKINKTPSYAQKQRSEHLKMLIRDIKEEIAAIQNILRRIS